MRYADWASHGICGRGVLLDLVGYHTKNGGELPYNPWTTHAISVSDLRNVAEHQGVQFRHGDILLLRVGFIQKYNRVTSAERDALQRRPETLYVNSYFFERLPISTPLIFLTALGSSRVKK